MIGHTELFLALMGTFCTLALTLGLVYARRARRLVQTPDVLVILQRLQPVDTSLLLAAGHEPSGELEATALYERLEGLEALAGNCAVLIDLACYVQRWHPEALAIAEQLRLNAREIDWHLDRLRGAAARGRLDAAYPDYAGRAVALYGGMTRHVVELYQITQVPGWMELVGAL